MSRHTKAPDKKFLQRVEALRARLATGGGFDAASLSQSYGLPLQEVERQIRSFGHGK